MANTKQAKFIIDVSAEKKRVTESSVRFFSYDSKTAEIIIQAEKEEQLISKSIVSNVEIFFESVDASFQPTDKLKWKDQMTVVADGLFSYLLPDELLNYQGLVAFEIYINYTNNDKSDSSYRIVYAQRSSAIDRAAGEIELVYIKDFEALKKEVADKAAEVKESLAGYDSGLDIYADQKKTEMDAFSTSVGTLASAEKLKIQAELPTVQQISTSETTKIKAELPAVQAVATTEIGKITAVLPTIENAAMEVINYADQKIIEYDAKLEESNQSINTLSQNLSDLKAGMQLSDAYAWSADGTDRFTKVYPRENLLIGSDTELLLENVTDGGSSKSLPSALLSNQIIGKKIAISVEVEARNVKNIGPSRVGFEMICSTTEGKNAFMGVWKSMVGIANLETMRAEAIIDVPSTLTLNRYLSNALYIQLNGEYIRAARPKVEIIDDDTDTSTIYTPAPSEDPINAYPQYRGLALLSSDLPEDYVWEESAERIKQLAQQETDKLKGEVADIQNWIAQQGGTI